MGSKRFHTIISTFSARGEDMRKLSDLDVGLFMWWVGAETMQHGWNAVSVITRTLFTRTLFHSLINCEKVCRFYSVGEKFSPVTWAFSVVDPRNTSNPVSVFNLTYTESSL